MRAIKICNIFWVCALALILMCSQSCSQTAEETVPEKEAHDFSLEDLEGKAIKLSQFRKKSWVLLHFWAIWCPHCRKSIPWLEQAGKSYSGRLRILAINIGVRDSLEHIRRYKKRHGITYTILYDKGSIVSRRYKIVGVPAYVLIDPQGIIRYYYFSPPDLKRLIE